MNKFSSLLVRRKRVTFTARIEFNSENRKSGRYLRRGFDNREISFGRVEAVAREVIVEELPTDMIELFGLNVKTRIVGVRDGSLLLFFEAMLAGYNIISDYSGFYDSIKLIQSQCNRLLSDRLEQKFGDQFDIYVDITYPSIPEPPDREFGRWINEWRHFGHMKEGGFPPMFTTGRRDGLFYFLAVLSAILLLIIGFLVYGAVVKTYFPTSPTPIHTTQAPDTATHPMN